MSNLYALEPNSFMRSKHSQTYPKWITRFIRDLLHECTFNETINGSNNKYTLIYNNIRNTPCVKLLNILVTMCLYRLRWDITNNRTNTPVSVPNEQQLINNPATADINNIMTEIKAFYLNYTKNK